MDGDFFEWWDGERRRSVGCDAFDDDVAIVDQADGATVIFSPEAMDEMCATWIEWRKRTRRDGAEGEA